MLRRVASWRPDAGVKRDAAFAQGGEGVGKAGWDFAIAVEECAVHVYCNEGKLLHWSHLIGLESSARETCFMPQCEA